ncbi:MAG: hypothetical protein KA383_04830 [Phycisphaerae bacterium]|nr:hypothetical protein [Phycisphaerae bacterium]
MPPALAYIPNRRWLAGTALVAGALAASLLPSCVTTRPELTAQAPSPLYPPPPQVPRVVALGTLRGAPPPSRAEVNLTLFLFGAAPPPPLTIANPTGLAARERAVLICDHALSTVFRWDADTNHICEESLRPPAEHPFAIDLLPDGQRLLCDRRGVLRVAADGAVQQRYTIEGGPYRPSGVLAVDEHVWVANAAADRIEVFALDSGAHLRSIGRYGQGPAEFSLPRSLARTPDGNICIVDVLNNRVQVLGPDGTWVRDVGGPGDTTGRFGRPRDVAVGPDGAIFVSDTFSQRVHAFTRDGQPLLAFGEPGSGPGALALPAGVAISAHAPQTETAPAVETVPAYYVLVAEQLDRPGVRVYAWLAGNDKAAAEALPAGTATNWKPTYPESAAINPHWDATRCATCHTSSGGKLFPIAPEAVNALCISCHDGVKAPADPHPIGRAAQTDLVQTPDDWPTVDGAIGCLTCHDIKRHCEPTAQRPAVNAVLLRHYDAQQPLEYCGNCHTADIGGRFSPHQQRDASGKVREDACLFCHTRRPEVPADGRRRFEPHVRVESSDLCLNCHVRHWDLSPLGHVDRPVTPAIRQWMLMNEMSGQANVGRAQLRHMADESGREPARLPLGKNRVTCYTCHNPHYAGMFPPDSELGALAANPVDRKAALRTDWIDLCSECHHH